MKRLGQDVGAVSYGFGAPFAVDPGDVGQIAALKRKVNEDRAEIQRLDGLWREQFSLVYGPLSDAMVMTEVSYFDPQHPNQMQKAKMDKIAERLRGKRLTEKEPVNTAPRKPVATSSGDGAGTYRNEPWNGMQIKYSISGANVTEASEGGPFCCWIKTLKGTLADSGTLAVSGSVGMGSGYHADAVVTVNAGGKSNSWKTRIKTGFPSMNWVSFNVSVPIPPDAKSGTVSIAMTGSYNAGSRGLSVEGAFTRDSSSTTSQQTPSSPPPRPATATVHEAPAAKWSGTWKSNFGALTINTAGATITGTYTHEQGKISGRLEGNRIVGRWSESPSYKGPKDSGTFELTLSPDGKSFTGKFRYEGSAKWDGEWTGTR